MFLQGSASPSLHHTLPRRVPDRAELCLLQTEACSIHWEVAGDSAGRPKDGERNDYTVFSVIVHLCTIGTRSHNAESY